MNTTEVIVKCKGCQVDNTITVPIKGYDAWKKGELIQRAMPTVSIQDRELLISGICPDCWDKMFPPEEDEDDEFSPESIFKSE